ncbi:response regulator transcription factor [Hominifimenecus sp. rT4P-3]|uniref:response regulator transcription factor n=1 Tax=Hominifimenecus sp. rT4P-3 TaxID=3242979 RepID=UPI003DA60865
MRLLYVEDEDSLRTLTRQRLEEAGYTIDCCADGAEALDFLAVTEYDAIILDIMLPKVDGLSVLRQIRREGNHTPVLLLTAKGSVSDRVDGLDSGADDYLIKPFSFEELSARIRVMLRRAAGSPGSNLLTLADLTLDLNTRKVMRAGKEIALTTKEYAVLEYLLVNKNIVLTREKIEQHIWNYEYEGGSNVIDVYIRCLRKKLDTGYPKKLIHTIRGTGYVIREEE